MSGKLRYWVAAGMLLFLVTLYVAAPAPEHVFEFQSKQLLQGLLEEYETGPGGLLRTLSVRGETAYRAREGLALDAPLPKDLDAADLALVALDGRPFRFSFTTRVPEVTPATRARWQSIVTAWAAASKVLELTDTGPPLTFGFDPAADRRRVSLRPPAISTDDLTQPLDLPERVSLVADFRSLLPPFLTILMAVLLGRTILALSAGVLLGGFLYAHDLTVAAGQRSFYDEFLAAIGHITQSYVWGNVVSDDFQLKILLFTLLLSMAVGIMTKCGGIEGMIRLVRRFANGARSSQAVAWIMGLLVFFDDYANTIVVGSTMRPLTDRLRVSREKLAYIVDSTAAPVAGLSLLSTWVAYEISTFAPSLPEVTDASGRPFTEQQGFAVFLQTLPFRFYCILTLCMVALTIFLRREFGPMLHAERRARRHGKLIDDDAQPLVSKALTETRTKSGAPALWWNGLLPILTLLGVTIWQIWETGKGGLEGTNLGFLDNVRQVLKNAESTHAIFVGAAAAAALAAALAMAQRILSLWETLTTATKAVLALSFAVVILVLAWSMGDVCKDDLGTAYYLVALTKGRLPPLLLPALLFLLSCLIAFSIGSSWSTMAILLPNVVLLAHSFGQETTLGGPALMTLSIGAVLEGSIFGDHCSPISDTTVLSSVASASDHLHHVRTQIPYAVLVMMTSMIVGYLPVAFISPDLWPLSLILGVAVISAFLLLRGRDPESPEAA